MKLESAVQDFLLATKADGLKESTIHWYRSMLAHMIDHFQGVELESISTVMLRQYIVTLRQRENRYSNTRAQRPEATGGLSQDSISGHIRTLHRFWTWCSREYRLAHNPMANIKRPPRAQAQPKAISLDDVKKLFEATANDAAGARDRAMLAFMLDTGCRTQGLLQLEPSRLDMENRRAIVAEKGRPQRPVFFTKFTAELLQRWLEVRPINAKTVFCSLSPAFIGKPLSYEGLVGILTRLKRSAGVQGRVNPHSFRHGFAREYIRNGGDLATLSRLMGHADSMVTAWYYAVFTAGELADIHHKFSPMNSLSALEDKDENEG